MLLQTSNGREFSRRRKTEVASRHIATERPVIERMKNIVTPFDPVPDGEIIVAQTVGDSLEILYKPRIGQEEFDRLTLPIHQ